MSSSDVTTAGGRVVDGVGGTVVVGEGGLDCDDAVHEVARTSGA